MVLLLHKLLSLCHAAGAALSIGWQQTGLHSRIWMLTCVMLRQCIHMVMSFVVAADNVFRLLHTRVAILFSEQLQKDLASLKQGKPADVSLAAKWAPTPGGKLYYLC